MTELKALLYVSSSTRLLSQPALESLLQSARRTNERIAVTGLLLHCEGNFMQYIEGPQAAIDDLFTRILADDRHQGLITIHEGPVDARQFAGWSMAYAPAALEDLAQLSGAAAAGRDGAVRNPPGFDAGRLLGDFWKQHRHASRHLPFG